MEKKEKQQFSFSTYEAYKKIKKDDPLKLIYDAIDWSGINSILKDEDISYSKKDLLYTPIALFKAQFLLYLGEVKSNRDLAEKLRFNTKYCLLCGFNNFLKTPAHSTFSAFRKKIGENAFNKVMQKIIAQSVPSIIENKYDISVKKLHISICSKDNEHIKCNCKGKCKFNISSKDQQKNISKKNYVFINKKIKLFIDKKTGKPIGAEIKPK